MHLEPDRSCWCTYNSRFTLVDYNNISYNMTVKLFRRGSARCIGLFAAFFTIMLCLYYMSIGQQTQQSLGGPGAADGTSSAAAALLSKGVYAAQRLVRWFFVQLDFILCVILNLFCCCSYFIFYVFRYRRTKSWLCRNTNNQGFTIIYVKHYIKLDRRRWMKIYYLWNQNNTLIYKKKITFQPLAN